MMEGEKPKIVNEKSFINISFIAWVILGVLLISLLWVYDNWRTKQTIAENEKIVNETKQLEERLFNEKMTKTCGVIDINGFFLSKFNQLDMNGNYSLVCVFSNGLEGYVLCSDKNAIVPKGLNPKKDELCTNKGYRVCYRVFNLEEGRWKIAGQTC